MTTKAQRTTSKPAEKATPIEQTPEFSAAVFAASEKIKADILGNLSLAREGAALPDAATLGGDQAFAEKLAMAISALTDQGTGRKRVSPEIVRQRFEARDLMVKLIVEARASNQIPSYGLRNKVYLDEVLVDPVWIAADHTQQQTKIEWSSVPNEAMVPLNDVAKGIYKAFMDSIGSVEKAPSEAALQGVTAGGLVVRSGSSAMRPLKAVGGESPHVPTEGGLNIPHRGKPGQFKETRILGTVMEPARQTA